MSVNIDLSQSNDERRHQNAIAVLQRCSGDTGDSAYDHLVAIIRKLIDERPNNVVDYFEEFSRHIRQERFQINTENIPNFYCQPILLPISKIICANLKRKELTLTHNIVRTQFYWSLAGIGMPLEKALQLATSIQNLIQSCSHIKNCRFWGKIYGLHKNYYIVESLLTNEGVQERVAASIYELKKNSMNTSKNTKSKTFQEIQMHKTYFVCNSFTEAWTELPPVTASQIQYSRQITKYLTGNLDSKILSYPPFCGTEKNLLRAIIARISASTQVVPYAFCQGNEIGSFTKNSDPSMLEDLLHPDKWMHLCPELDANGSINTKCTELASCSNDIFKNCNMPVWSNINPNNFLTPISLIALKSNTWPGAFTFASNEIFDNIFIGWGFKASDPCHNPTLPPYPEKEYSTYLGIPWEEYNEPVFK